MLGLDDIRDFWDRMARRGWMKPLNEWTWTIRGAAYNKYNTYFAMNSYVRFLLRHFKWNEAYIPGTQRLSRFAFSNVIQEEGTYTRREWASRTTYGLFQLATMTYTYRSQPARYSSTNVVERMYRKLVTKLIELVAPDRAYSGQIVTDRLVRRPHGLDADFRTQQQWRYY